MFNAVVLCIMAAIVFSIRKWLIKTEKIEAEREMFETVGVINQVIYSEGGNARYDVVFFQGKSRVVAQSIYYSSCTPTLNIGEQVEIAYYYTKKGRVYAMILNQNLVPCDVVAKPFRRCLTAMGIVFLVLAGYLFIKNL